MCKSNVYFLLLITPIVVLLGCNNRGDKLPMSQIPSYEINVSVFMGHQSVGENILIGVSSISDSLPIIEIEVANELKNIDQPSIYHSRIGQNTKPFDKIDHFSTLIRSGIGNEVNVAIMKLCYIDIDISTDIIHLYDAYIQTIESLEQDYPDVKMLYATVPLMAIKRNPKSILKRLLGRYTSGKSGNVKRYQFNQLLRESKGWTGRLFDIARLESMKSNGQSVIHKYKGEKYEALRRDLTSDGGHLNEKGRKLVAFEFLALVKSL